MSTRRGDPLPLLQPHSRIYVAGHSGLVGSALMRRLERGGFTNVLTATRQQLDLRDQAEVSHWFKANRPEYVFLVAGTVGGIMANSTRPAEFIYDNMMIHGTVVHASHEYDVTQAALPRLVVHLPASRDAADHRGAAAHRPARADQRVVRDRQDRRHQALPGVPAASTGATSSRRCRPTSTARTTTSTSPSSHVLPALIRKFHDAKAHGGDEVEIWGTGSADARVPPRRRPRRRVPAPDGALLRRPRTSTSAPASTSPSASSPRRSATSSTPTPSCASTRRSRTARRARCSTSPACATTGWAPTIDLDTGIRTTYQWFLDEQAAHHDLRGIEPEPAGACAR